MGWLGAVCTLLFVSAAAHLTWESLQLPLYTIWWTGTAAEIGFAVLHCTAGDLVVMTSSPVTALVLFGFEWPSTAASFRQVMFATIETGVACSVFSEWVTVNVRGAWAYTAWMLRIPPFGTGLFPLLQWIGVPGLSFMIVRLRVLAEAERRKSPCAD